MANYEARMTFTEHLAELRLRIIYSAIAIGVGFAFAYIFSNQIFEVVARPLMPSKESVQGAPTPGPEGATAASSTKPEEEPAPQAPEWVALTPLEAFVVKLKLSVYAGLLLALPVVVYQLCSFIFPGLTPRERKVVKFMLGGCSFFVVFGVLVAYFGVFPLVLPYLSSFLPVGVSQQFRMNETVNLILLGIAGFAVAFQFPMAVLVLVYLDLLSPETLRQHRRLAIVIIAIGSAILTPPDPISMTVMTVPLVFLYEASIWMSYLVIRSKRKAETA